MPSVLILCAHRPKRSPSQRYRFEQYISFLEKQGFEFTFSYLLNQKDDQTFYSHGNFFAKAIILLKSVLIRIRDCWRFRRFDMIFIQREASFLGTSFAERRAFHSGAFVIFDFDDSIWLADTSPGNKKWEWIKKPEKFFKNITYAHRVIAGNAYLAAKAKPFNSDTIIIPTTVDTDIHVPKPELRDKHITTIGWSGSISTVKHFELLVPVLLRIRERFGNNVKFKILGDTDYRHEILQNEAVAWTEENEVNELNTFDIGIMPLPDDEWANGKCGLKGLTYMACEVATIMSAVGINNEVISDGTNGFLARNDEEWYKKLCILIEDRMLRKELALNGRKTVIERYSVEANKNLYLDLFKHAKHG
jgi:glycosyltransferase involved in cell wall biosynthesis